MSKPQGKSDAARGAHTEHDFTRQPLEEPTCGRLLIAEDNLINQKVILSQIENLGYQADVVANGSEALDAVARAPYAAVLMDCHMPVMDGLTATAEIRRREGGYHRLPVIAVTANGNREDCLSAGMDDYLAKPVRQQELANALARWITHRPDKDSASNGNSAKLQSDARTERDDYTPTETEELRVTGNACNDYDFGEASISERLAELREECGAEMVASFIEMFVADTSERLKRLHGLVAQLDSNAIEREAHSLKGSCANLGVVSMASLCQHLETEAEAGSFASTNEFMERLDFEFERLKPVLTLVLSGTVITEPGAGSDRMLKSPPNRLVFKKS